MIYVITFNFTNQKAYQFMLNNSQFVLKKTSKNQQIKKFCPLKTLRFLKFKKI